MPQRVCFIGALLYTIAIKTAYAGNEKEAGRRYYSLETCGILEGRRRLLLLKLRGGVLEGNYSTMKLRAAAGTTVVTYTMTRDRTVFNIVPCQETQSRPMHDLEFK
ncbi:hypothetical protein GGS26DRAFT_215412 [Hypomontagnella submonticulosa]|nr:hypothetical protein GGS26DRAFT_215412 [Hypomontagnella submonticulosa]